MTHLEPEYPDAAKVSPFFRDFLQKEVADDVLEAATVQRDPPSSAVPWPIPESRAYEQLREQLYDVLKRNAIDDDWLAIQLADEMWRMLGHEFSDRTPDAVR